MDSCTERTFPTDPSKAVLLLQCFFVCASEVSYVASVLSLLFPHISFFWCLGKVALHDCGISWVSLVFKKAEGSQENRLLSAKMMKIMSSPLTK